MKVGAQLYTIRNFSQNERDLGHALEKIAGMGYKTVQLSAIGPIDPKVIKGLCDRNGLQIVLTHNNENKFLTGVDAMIEEHQIYGCKYVGLGSMPERYRNNAWLDCFRKDFMPAMEKLHAAGMRMMYHNHAFEFTHTADGRTLMDAMMDSIPAELMGITADTYWLQFGGVNVKEWLSANADRLPCVHFKDYIPMLDNREIHMAACGTGNIDFKGLIELLNKNGVTEYALVEQDLCYDSNPFDCLKVSHDNLAKAGAEF